MSAIGRSRSRVGAVAVVAVAFVLAMAGGAAHADRALRGDVPLRLLDATTRAVVARQDVEVRSDNGVRCIKAPCPTNEKLWKGRTDAQGRVTVPAAVVQEQMQVRTLPDGQWAVVAPQGGAQDVAVVRKAQ